MSFRLTITVLFLCIVSSYGARILGIFPIPMYSHQVVFQAVMKSLAARGHQVTVISPNPLKVPVDNYTDIDLSFSYNCLGKSIDLSEDRTMGILSYLDAIDDAMYNVLDAQLGSPQLQKFIRSNETRFDLVIKQNLFHQSYNGLVYHIGSPPVVGILPLGALTYNYASIGNPNNPAYSPNNFLPYTHRMTFWQRLHNTYVYLQFHYLSYFKMLPRQETLMRKYFGSGPPSVYESEYNDSLLLVNSHWSINYPRPLLPNVVELTGLHIQTSPKPLEMDIHDFLSGAKHGVIFFSLGTKLRSDAVFKTKLNDILEVFSKLPQRVVWKWESEFLPGKPENVMVNKWLPQQDILAHPNVRVFITHGGLTSFQEAAYHAVPLIGIPFVADQTHNVEKFVAEKIGVRLNFKDLTKDTLMDAIQRILTDSSYHDNMKKFSSIYREQAESSMDRAMWWIEHVLKHNGATHMRTAALDLSWTQYLLLDILAVFILGLLSICIFVYIALKKAIYIVNTYITGCKIKQA